MSENPDKIIDPQNNPEDFAMFVLLSDGEVFGHITLPINFAEAMVAGFRSPNISAVEVPVGTVAPKLFSTWNGEEFLPPANI